MSLFTTYLNSLFKTAATGQTTEASFYSDLKALVGDFAASSSVAVTVVAQPQHVKDAGAPDFVVLDGNNLPIGYIEAKDLGVGLDQHEKSEQIQRYIKALPNLILTNYLEFRWFVAGQRQEPITVANYDPGTSQIARRADATQKLRPLLQGFLAPAAPPLGTAEELARRLADLAHLLRDAVLKALPTSSHLQGLRQVLQETLLPDLSEESFADLYAQTFTYGLFAARMEWQRGPGGTFTVAAASQHLPQVNPFLANLYYQITGPVLEPTIAWAADAVACLLDRADLRAILTDFARKPGREDPVVHFYEDFLRRYDPKEREIRGVYYTPEPVVDFIVRAVDHLLRTRFQLPAGLADNSRIAYQRPAGDIPAGVKVAESHRVLVLDPAAGTGTFLYFVIRLVHDYLVSQGQAGAWPAYAQQHLVPRLFGLELMMAPYVIAHLKLGTQLRDLGASLDSNPRLHIYLTNTLEPPLTGGAAAIPFLSFLTEEAAGAEEARTRLPIMVVLGNPPYSNFGMLNKGQWIEDLLEDYKKNLHEKKLNIDDDYIKFIRFAQWRIEQTGYGILGFITNNSYLDGLTHRRMRECLLESFTNIYILNLHGSSRRGEQAPGNMKDENVFDIQQGVAIGIFIKEPNKADKTHVYYADMWGVRENKYRALFEFDVESTSWQELSPTTPYFFFVPKDFSLQEEYAQWWSIREIFTVSQNGLKTDRDELFLDFDKQILKERMRTFFSKSYGDDFRERYRVFASSSFDIEVRRNQTSFDQQYIKQCLYRPFDIRYLYYDPNLTSRPAYKVMRHMLSGENIGLVTTRQTRDKWDALATRLMCGHKAVAAYDINSLFPLYLYSAEGGQNAQAAMAGVSPWPEGKEGRRPNLSPEFIADLERRLGVRFRPHPRPSATPSPLAQISKVLPSPSPQAQISNVLPSPSPQAQISNVLPSPSPQAEREPEGEVVTPEDVFHYIYAVFHSPSYRERYAEFLKMDFPRIPLTSNLGLFRSLVEKGKELAALHLLESPVLRQRITRYPVPGDNVVEPGHPRYLAPGEPEPGTSRPLTQGRVYISRDNPKTGKRGQYIEGVPPEVWGFQVGGYQVAQKWLSDRKGRKLEYDDITYYQRVISALARTRHLMQDLDQAIDQAGGWPIQQRRSLPLDGDLC